MKKGYWILLAGLGLIIFGLLAVYSVSIYESFTLTRDHPAQFSEITNYFYFFKQIKIFVISLIAILLLWKIPFPWIKNHTFATVFMIIAFIFQLLVFHPTIGWAFQGAKGWIVLPGLGTVQPVEVFKLAYIFFLASWLVRKKDTIQKKEFISLFIGICALLYFILMLIPDFGSVLIMGGTALLMVRFAGLSVRRTLVILAMGIGAGVFAGFSMYLIKPDLSYLKNRFSYFFSTSTDSNQGQGIGRQNEQALIAMGGGGLFGQGYGKGLQKFGNIPEAQSDFIFAAFSEEIGLFGNLILLGLYLFIAIFFLKNLEKIHDFHTKMIGVGIISIMIVQTFVHIGVNIQILPNTGVTLPLVSAGGTSILVSCVELMILYKILQSNS